jgi:hypothetical protein
MNVTLNLKKINAGTLLIIMFPAHVKKDASNTIQENP